MRRLLVSAVTMSLLLATAGAQVATAAPQAIDGTATNAPKAADDAAIRKLLSKYMTSVSTGDRIAFESQLLDLKIPFAYVKEGAHTADRSDLATFQDYAGFRKVIFDSGKRYQQRFGNIRIEQVGNLAQVSLDYQTALQGAAYEGKGWKVLQLIKLNGQWKIASEFFTEYPAE